MKALANHQCGKVQFSEQSGLSNSMNKIGVRTLASEVAVFRLWDSTVLEPITYSTYTSPVVADTTGTMIGVVDVEVDPVLSNADPTERPRRHQRRYRAELVGSHDTVGCMHSPVRRLQKRAA
jgi:hypothetical protein